MAKFYETDLTEHRSMLMTKEMVEHSDMIVCMEKWHSDIITKQYPAASNKIYLLSLFDKNEYGNNFFGKFNIPDPYGKEVYVFQRVFDRISECIEEMIKKISKQNNSG